MQGKKRIIRRIYVNRIIAVLLITGFLISLAVVIVTVVQNRRTFYIETKNFYSVQMGEFDTELKAFECAQNAVKSGAAGYIFNDGKFRVLSSVYLKSEDADSVVSRLKDKGYEAKKILLTYSAVRLKTFYNKDYTVRLNAIIKYPHYAVATKLYELGLSLDKGEISESFMLTEAANILTNVRTNLAQLKNDAVFKETAYSEELTEGYELVAKVLDELIKPDTSVRVTSRIKAAMLKIVYEYLPYFNRAFKN